MSSMIETSRVSLVLTSLVVLFGCGGESRLTEGTASISEPVIYGVDNRSEALNYTSSVPNYYRLQATALLGSSTRVNCGSSTCDLALTTWDDESIHPIDGLPRRLCSDQSFWYQDRMVPGGSGFLVAPNLMLTAQHVLDEVPCGNLSIIFDFAVDSGLLSPWSVPKTSVFTCNAVVASSAASERDWALIRLDREVTNRVHFILRRSGEVSDTQTLSTTGHPYSLPLKLAGGSVLDNSDATYFTHNADVFGGNSGGPVFQSDTGVVEGIVSYGPEEWCTAADHGATCATDADCLQPPTHRGWQCIENLCTRFQCAVPLGSDLFGACRRSRVYDELAPEQAGEGAQRISLPEPFFTLSPASYVPLTAAEIGAAVQSMML
jgi:hypothetical protein